MDAETEAQPAAASPEPPPGEDREVDVIHEGAADVESSAAAPAVAAPQNGRPDRDRRFFPLGAGYGVLGRIDLSPCRDEGLQPGYWHVRVTFERSGRIVHASVQSPTAPPPDALACVSEELATPTVAPFDGDDVTLSKNFFVEARSPGDGNDDGVGVETPAAPAAPVSPSSPTL